MQDQTWLEHVQRINQILQCALIEAIDELKEASSASRAREIEERGFRFSDELLKQNSGLRIRQEFDEIIISPPETPLNQINKIEESKDILQEAEPELVVNSNE